MVIGFLKNRSTASHRPCPSEHYICRFSAPVFPNLALRKVTIIKAPARSGSASNRYGLGNPKVIDE